MSRPRYEESGVIVGGTLLWPMVTVLGFLALTGVVVALGASATARYEFERNGAREPKRAAVPAGSSAHPAGSRTPARQAEATEAAAVGVAVRPVVTPVVEHAAGTRWGAGGAAPGGGRRGSRRTAPACSPSPVPSASGWTPTGPRWPTGCAPAPCTARSGPT